MSALLGPFNFSKERQAFFQVRIQIHELTHVPLVEGSFKAKWKIDNVHHIANAAAAGNSVAHTVAASSRDTGAASGDSANRMMESLSLRRHRSNSTLASQLTSKSASDRDSQRWSSNTPKGTDGSVDSHADSTSLQSSLGKDGEKNERPQSASGLESSHHRTSSGRPSILTHVRGIFTQNSSNASSGANSPVPDSSSQTERDRGDKRPEFDMRRQSSTSLPSPQKSIGNGSDDRNDHSMQESNSSSSIVTHDFASSHGHAPQVDASTSDHPDKYSNTAENHLHPTSSQNRREDHSLKKNASKSSSLRQQSARDDRQSRVPKFPEPRGETESRHVKDHRVHWEREIEVGVRIPVDKARPRQKPGSGKSSSGDRSMRRPVSARNLHAESEDGHSRSERGSNGGKDDLAVHLHPRYGMLGHADLRILVRAEVPTEKHGSHGLGRPTEINMGHVVVNLAEFAPFASEPGKGSQDHHAHHSHNHHHGHQHINHHHHHHHHNHHRNAPSRTETRRYLLSDGPTNATLKLTIEMTHAGGTLDYSVPRNKSGMVMISSAVTEVKESGSERGSRGSVGSSGSSSEMGLNNAETTQNISPSNRRQHSKRPGSGDRPQSSVKSSSSSICLKRRIPAENLTTKLTHHDAARAIKEIGGADRLALSFSAAAHHDRAPEDIVEMLFDPKVSSEQLSRLIVATSGGSSGRQSKNLMHSNSSRSDSHYSSSTDLRLRNAKSARALSSKSAMDTKTPTKPRLSLPEDTSANKDEQLSPSASGGPKEAVSRPGMSRTSTVRWNDQLSAEPADRPSAPDLQTSATLQSLSPTGRAVIASSPLSISPDFRREAQQPVVGDIKV